MLDGARAAGAFAARAFIARPISIAGAGALWEARGRARPPPWVCTRLYIDTIDDEDYVFGISIRGRVGDRSITAYSVNKWLDAA